MSDDPLNPQEKDKQDVASIDLGSNPVMNKIGRLLTSSKGSDWKQGGFTLSPETRMARPLQVHQFVYVRDLGEKSLILKAETPVSCHYAGGGYRLTPVSGSNFTVEIRDRVFDPEKLVDPKYAPNFKGKQVDVVATGEIAKKLFEGVRNLVNGSVVNIRKDFEDNARELLDTLLQKIESGEARNWARTIAMVEDRENTSYTSTINNLEITLLRSVHGWDAYYELKIKQAKFEIGQSGSNPKLIFNTLEQTEQQNQLDGLEKKLRELGLED